jgi:hypothetical protein
MTKQFGTAYTSLPITKRGPGSKFMEAFESAKRNFGWAPDDKPMEIGPIAMKLRHSLYYDDDEQTVKLSKYGAS